MVDCRALAKHYGNDDARVMALRGVDLTVRQGEMLMLVGPSGCGKTTLISIIAGILDPSGGDIEILGQNLRQMRKKELIEFRAQNIGFIFQSYNLLPALSAMENVAIPLLVANLPRQAALDKAAEMLSKVGLGDKLHSLPSQLSGGQQQRVAVARAMVHNPKLIVCDEPTSALDHDTGMKVIELLRGMVREFNHTIIIVTHDNRIFHYGDRIAHMDDGHLVSITTPEQVAAS